VIFSKQSPVLTPEDLGIDLEEDSPDVTEEEVAEAIDTDGAEDFAQKVLVLVGNLVPDFELRRRAGILYSRVLYSGQGRLFRVDWLRKGA
jgi:hypothetical protein